MCKHTDHYFIIYYYPYLFIVIWLFCVRTPAPGLQYWEGGPGMYGSGTADWYSSLMFSEPTPQPGCAVYTQTQRGKGKSKMFKAIKQHYSCSFVQVCSFRCINNNATHTHTHTKTQKSDGKLHTALASKETLLTVCVDLARIQHTGSGIM